jgi:multiple sugar transport system substrate-binding protein
LAEEGRSTLSHRDISLAFHEILSDISDIYRRAEPLRKAFLDIILSHRIAYAENILYPDLWIVYPFYVSLIKHLYPRRDITILDWGGLYGHVTALLKEAGYEKLPSDIEGFIKCCKKLKAKGHPTGFALGHAVGDGNTWTHWWLWSFGGKAVEKDGKTIAINSKETVQALDAAKELYETMIPGVASWLDPHNNKAFLSGQISVTSNGNSIFYASMKKFPDINKDLMTMNFPVGPVGHPAELSMISQAFIFKHTPVPNAAKHYLTFMFEKAQYGKWESETWGYITQTLKDYYNLPAWKKDPRITPYRECVKRMLWNGYAGPMGPASAAAMSEYVIVDMFADVCVGGKSPKAAAAAAERKLKKFYR